jgi:diguanylate cyclase (GGDEF)-like protein
VSGGPGGRTTRETSGGQAQSQPSPLGAGLLVLAVLGFIALSVVYMESVRLPDVAGRMVAELAFLVPLALSVSLCAVAYRRSLGTERRFWLMATGLNAVLLVSEAYYTWWVAYYGSPPPGIYAPFQVMHTVAAIFFCLVLGSMTRMANAPVTRRLRWRIDLVSAGVVTYVLALESWVDGVLAGVPGVNDVGRLIAAVYPTWGVLMILGTLWMMLRPAAVRRRLWERLVAVSLLIYEGGITAWPIWYAAFLRSPASAAERSALDLVLVLGHCLFTMAAAVRLLHTEEAWPLHRGGPVRLLPARTAAYAAVTLNLIALPTLVYLAVFSPAGTLDRTVYIAAALVVSVLMIARTIVAAMENGRLFHRSVTDPLTGLYNHRYFHERVAAEMDVAQRYGEPLSVMSIDLDDFDAVNRKYGHTRGDDVLRAVGAALRGACRNADVVCRVGADEFAVIMSCGTNASGALQIALRVQEEIRGVSVPDAVPMTASIGIAAHPEHASDPDTLLRLADGAAYWAKQHGKDQALIYDPRTVSELSAEDRIRTIERRTQLGTVRALALAVDSRHGWTRSRSSVVPGLTASLARRLGLSEDRIRLVETAAALRDVGMIAVGDDVLTKAGRLDDAEQEQVRRHPALGEQIVGATMPDIALPWIRHHHERWDGHGYPDRLRAVAIPLEARILAVCDAWGAMTSDRAYAPALSDAEAVAELRKGAGTQFDPSVVDVFLESIGVAGDS